MTTATGRGQTLTIGIELVTEECCNCGVLFAMSRELYARKLRGKDTANFYCPNGHSQHYVGESEAAKIKRLEQANHNAWEQAEREAERRRAAERRASAARGQVTKMRKRAITGVCAFCHRHFVNVERHVASKHPDEKP